MACGITKATPEDRQIQQQRFDRAVISDLIRRDVSGVFYNRAYRRQFVGYCVGRGFEYDYLEANQISDLMRYNIWLRWSAPANWRTYEKDSSLVFVSPRGLGEQAHGEV